MSTNQGIQTKKLGEICEKIGSGITPKGGDSVYIDHGTALIRSQNVHNSEFSTDGLAYVDDEIAERMRGVIVLPKDVLLNITGDSVARSCMVPDDALPARVNQHVAIIRPESEKLLPEYLSHFLVSPQMQKKMLSWAGSGGTRKALTKAMIEDFEVPLPEIEVQRRVSTTLTTYNDLVRINRRRIVLLEEAARLLYREWFIHFRFPGHEHVSIVGGVPEGWKDNTLGNLVELVKSTVKPESFEEDDIHIGLEHIPRRSVTLTDWESIEGLASSKFRFQEGDILFGKIRPYFHKVGFTICSGLASSDAFVWRVIDEDHWPFVVCATSSDYFVAVASKTVREGSKMPRADWKVLVDFRLPIPPESLLKDFNEFVGPILAQCKALALENRALVTARDLLLPRLMDGRIEV